ncbi:Patatin-like phospholipase domain-containing protein ZK370.4 [Caenorhabditis elegans]|uniref:Isoform a of Patatin-like phospholipase domain-containing protein ZK370.4 n=1 Tax=Caenorhabditis elegans TaxID=6239 RepID=Q02331-2|nr:Patatin-like phospholipase domain-containing protein ZK370.4 [Caenorhabditis elegans]CCD61723.1 Patatin-like phospholipase domain-containing protein ZK370.4 [Caenorhabditis elegans]|eukprot:NP_498926.2 Uncharacterized NTE family protein ZK370.4 [Caenorhabditis elegans]
MSFFYSLFAPLIFLVTFIYNHVLLILFTVCIIGAAAFFVSYYLFGYSNTPSSASSSATPSSRNSPNKERSKKVPTILETDNEDDEIRVNGSPKSGTPTNTQTIEPPTSLNLNMVNSASGSNLSGARRMRKRDWAKKLYKSLVQDSPGRTPTDESSDEENANVVMGGGSVPRRRSKHGNSSRRRQSTAFQLAKDLIRRGSRSYFRQNQENNKDTRVRPPQEFFEPTDLPEIPQNLQPEIFYILHNLKMLELPSEWKLDPREIEVRSFQAGDYIVKPGESDDAIYVAIDGELTVHIRHMEGKEYLVKCIPAGGSFFSLLSMLDILMDFPSIFRTVALKAADPCRVAKFPITSFRESYHKNPEAWIRPIQIVITRLLHVTLTTLHQYMGLSSELMRRRRDDDRHRNGSSTSKLQLSLSLKKKEKPFNINDNEQDQLIVARKWMAEAFGLVADDVVSEQIGSKIHLESYEAGHVIIEQGAEEEVLMMVLHGNLILAQESLFDEENNEEDESAVIRVTARELVGGLQILTNEPSFYTIRAAVQTRVAIMKKKDFSAFLEAHPEIYLPVAHSVLRRLSPFLRGVDFALDWVLVDSGHACYRAGDMADSLFVVLSGRLRSVEKKTVVEEFGRGDVLGMMEVLTKKPRATTVLAVRFSQLARVPEGLLNFIKMQYPQVGFRLVQLLGQYYSQTNRRAPFAAPTVIRTNELGATDPMSHIKNLHTIAVVPASPDVPLVPFTCELYHALSSNLRVLRLSSQKVAACLDPSVLEKQADFRLMHWLNVQEDTYPLVIYECDFTQTNWTRRCLRQADAILVVAIGGKTPEKQTLMRELMNMNQDGVRTNKELILLWPESTKTPSGTIEWLKNSYFSGHHHIRAPKRMLQWNRKFRKMSRAEVMTPTSVENEVIEYYEKNVFWTPDRRSDFSRLARILTGNAIGLVLGGGGARGAAHVGVLRALREEGIPVDIVGGTSIGSLIGGLYAETPDDVVVETRAASWFNGMSSLWRKLLDLTYAHSAMFTGAQFNFSIKDLFEERLIEDLWISYFCISTDISTSEMRVHRSGPLWAYCRASMSLAGYLPPLCDPQDGHLLLDGGYVNNVPADVMRNLGARCVIACDVGSIEETNLYDYGDSLSGMWVLLKRLNPFGTPPRILNMEEIQSRLAYVSCVRQLEVVKKASYCRYLRPPIEPFKTLDFPKFQEIMELGLKYGREACHELITNDRAGILGDEKETRKFKRQQSRREKPDVSRAVSFTDLAAAMSKIPVVRPTLRHSMSLNPSANGPVGRAGDHFLLDDDLFNDTDYYEEESSQSENGNESFTEDEDLVIGPPSSSSSGGNVSENPRGTTPRPPSS